MSGKTIQFNRNELAGAFGDIGTDIPLIIGMILASGMDAASVLTVFGLLQILSGLAYRIPMPIQPLKAVAALVIAQRLPASLVFGGGLAIGLIMFPLAAFGLLDRLAKIIPKPVVRGIQFGLGLTLCRLALGNYVLAGGVPGYVVAGVSTVLILWLLGHRKYPPALGVVLLALIYAFVFNPDALRSLTGFEFALPKPHLPVPRDVLQGFLLLALPQIPLSLGNSIFATEQMARDLFPDRKITFRKIGLTYSIMNLTAPLLSGIPVCHGAGGMAGHCAFGARTGGSVIIYGTAFLLAGLCFSAGFDNIIHAFPLPVLGVILFFEGLTLMRFLRDTAQTERDLSIALLVGALAAFLPYGFLVGMIIGSLVWFLSEKYHVGFTKDVLN